MHLLLDTKLSSKVSGTVLYFYFDQQVGANPKSSRNLKLFEFFVDSSITDAKLFFVKLNYCLCQRGKELLSNFSATLQHFYFDKKNEKIFQTF